MKNKILAYLSVAVTNMFIGSAYAVAPGFYMGLAAGPATNNGGTQQIQANNTGTTTPANPRSNQVGTQLFMGYDFNQYVGAEGGLDYFSTIRYKTAAGATTCSTASAQVRGFDVLGKGMLPIKMVNLYGKAGAAIMYFSKSADFNPTCAKTSNKIIYPPMFSVGASYDLSQNWVADVSWSRIMVGNIVSSIDFYALGISYHFVDKFCGQFLCD